MATTTARLLMWPTMLTQRTHVTRWRKVVSMWLKCGGMALTWIWIVGPGFRRDKREREQGPHAREREVEGATMATRVNAVGYEGQPVDLQ